MAPHAHECLVVSDFNAEALAAYLNHLEPAGEIRAVCAPQGLVVSRLLDSGTWKAGFDSAVVWSQPHHAIASFGAMRRFEQTSLDHVLREVDAFADAIVEASRSVSYLLVPTWGLPSFVRGLGVGEYKAGGLAGALDRMNLRLAERFEHEKGVFLLDCRPWMATIGALAANPRAYYLGKTPFSPDVFRHAALEIRAAVDAIAGRGRRLVALDLDGTLWKGRVGEVGWEGLRLGGHDPVGEALVDFQAELKALRNRGVLLAILSKNDESRALQAIDEHPEMILRRTDFVGWRINWRDKASNLVELVDELNIGTESVVFIDDSPAERARIREALPEVLVPDWPSDEMLFARELQRLRCFDMPVLTAEDGSRTAMYHAERTRQGSRRAAKTVDDWLSELDLVVRAEPLTHANLGRVRQLLSKTNQMNLTTRRPSERALEAWGHEGANWMLALRVSDRHGDAGLAGVISLTVEGEAARLVDFVLSCRVFGRRIEELMAHVAVRLARELGAKRLTARYLPTARNAYCVDFWRERSGFSAVGDAFTWDVARNYPAPSCIRLEGYPDRPARAFQASAALPGAPSDAPAPAVDRQPFSRHYGTTD